MLLGVTPNTISENEELVDKAEAQPFCCLATRQGGRKLRKQLLERSLLLLNMCRWSRPETQASSVHMLKMPARQQTASNAHLFSSYFASALSIQES